MNLPILPTDNLYKFLALSGLALLVFIVVIPTNQINDIELKTIEVKTQISLLELEGSVLKRDVDVAGTKKKPTEEKVLKLMDRHQQFNAKLIQIQGQRERLAALSKQLGSALDLIWIGGFIGLVMTNVGFYLWYVRVQKPADILANKQLEAKDA